MIPLASDLLPFPGQMRREGHLKSVDPPDRLSSSGRIAIVGTVSRTCPAVLAVLCINHLSCGKAATEASVMRSGLSLVRLPKMLRRVPLITWRGGRKTKQDFCRRYLQGRLQPGTWPQ